jgi:macrodomain Ter protein organizer (MatP/YcbG family)
LTVVQHYVIMIWGDDMEHSVNKDNLTGTITNRGGYRKGAGRKPIGVTRKISLTLPESCWKEIDRYCSRGDYTISEVIRSIIEDNLNQADLL